jgi:predicted membrane-bound dolichyl-phosphate-mannose-protein mannosyltransferase
MFLSRLTQNVRIESCDTKDTLRKNHDCNQVIVSEIPWSWLSVVVVISAVYLLGTRTEMSFLCGVVTHVY